MNEPSDQQAIVSSLHAVPIEVTIPKSELKHYIADDELDRLCELRGDFVREGAWASLGLAGGTLAPFCQAVTASTNGQAVSPLNLFLSFLFAVAAGVTILCFILARSRGKGRSDLLSKIRSRDRIHMVPDLKRDG